MSQPEKEKPKPGMKNIPKDGQVIMAMMKEMGINEFDPKTIVQLCEFVYRYATSVLDEARMYANNSKKKFLDAEDVRLALQLTNESSFVTPPPREIILECAHVKNYAPLQPVKPHCGLRLPPDRYCLSQCNYTLKQAASNHKKTKTNYVVSGASTGLKITTKPNVSYIKRTNAPIGVTKQTVTIPKPKITTNLNLQPQKTVLKPKIHITQNSHTQLQMQTSMGSNGSNSMETMESLKRKREEDDELEGM
ncbi:transcription initiation factor TFIID subunit 9 [Coccinella septempunctata]|uniref:transcription initiation factor TFIID subunit 9 n=1 Tax=Coccinella septempunctata TaxID=41139 RepID=UPI001D0971A5|nr:transcription initiation factor TFIID subunit 9 [Coccinella septempunctata]